MTRFLAALVILLVLMETAYSRNRLWSDDGRLWENVIASWPHRARAHLNLCVHYSAKGRKQDAVMHCSEAIDHPQQEYITRDAYINRGAIYSESGDFVSAKQDYLRVLAMEPDNWMVYNNIAYIYALQGHLTEAVENYTHAILLNPNYERAYQNRGTVYLFKGDYRLAIDDFSRILSSNPQNTFALVKRGTAYEKSDMLPAALADMQQACVFGDASACSAARRLSPNDK